MDAWTNENISAVIQVWPDERIQQDQDGVKKDSVLFNMMHNMGKISNIRSDFVVKKYWDIYKAKERNSN